VLDVIRAIHHYSAWLYGLLAVLLALQLGTMWRAGRERELALFGLEREAATGKAVRAFVTLLLLVTIWAGVYTVAAVVAPTIPRGLQEVDGSPISTTPQLADVPTAEPTPTETEPPPARSIIVTSTPTP
jgi:hypothetical protein